MSSRPAEFLLVRSGVRALCGIPGSHAACVHARRKRCSGEISPSGPAPVSGTTPGMRAPYSGWLGLGLGLGLALGLALGLGLGLGLGFEAEGGLLGGNGDHIGLDG